jgi:tRNA(Ser,Leu) C12 N-acetylase TAN1
MVILWEMDIKIYLKKIYIIFAQKVNLEHKDYIIYVNLLEEKTLI